MMTMYLYETDNNLKVANRLFSIANEDDIDPGFKEGVERAAIGRLYYGCYLILCDIVEAKYGENIPHNKNATGTHERTIFALEKCPSIGFNKRDKKEIVSDMICLKGYRIHADYNKNRPFTSRQIDIATELAKDIHEKLKRF